MKEEREKEERPNPVKRKREDTGKRRKLSRSYQVFLIPNIFLQPAGCRCRETLSESARGALDARPTVAPVVPFPSARRLIDSFGGRF